MKIGKIDSKIAREIALSFYAEIPRYIEAHKSEYISWLAENGLQDDTITNKTEADK